MTVTDAEHLARTIADEANLHGRLRDEVVSVLDRRLAAALAEARAEADKLRAALLALTEELPAVIAGGLNGPLGCEEWDGERDTGCPDCGDLWRYADAATEVTAARLRALAGGDQP
jgi:hypothetical protein